MPTSTTPFRSTGDPVTFRETRRIPGRQAGAKWSDTSQLSGSNGRQRHQQLVESSISRSTMGPQVAAVTYTSTEGERGTRTCGSTPLRGTCFTTNASLRRRSRTAHTVMAILLSDRSRAWSPESFGLWLPTFSVSGCQLPTVR